MSDKKQKKPRLDNRVRNGLRSLAVLVEVGSCADIFGSDVDQMEEDGRIEQWENVLHACEWIRNLPYP